MPHNSGASCQEDLNKDRSWMYSKVMILSSDKVGIKAVKDFDFR